MAESSKTQTTTEAGPDSKRRSSSSASATAEVVPTFEGMLSSPEVGAWEPLNAETAAPGEAAVRNGRASRSPNAAGPGKEPAAPEGPQVDPIVERLWGLGRDFRPETFQRHVDFLGGHHLSHPANREQRATVVRELQRTYGNRYVQRVVEGVGDSKRKKTSITQETSQRLQDTKGRGQTYTRFEPVVYVGNLDDRMSVLGEAGRDNQHADVPYPHRVDVLHKSNCLARNPEDRPSQTAEAVLNTEGTPDTEHSDSRIPSAVAMIVGPGTRARLALRPRTFLVIMVMNIVNCTEEEAERFVRESGMHSVESWGSVRFRISQVPDGTRWVWNLGRNLRSQLAYFRAQMESGQRPLEESDLTADQTVEPLDEGWEIPGQGDPSAVANALIAYRGEGEERERIHAHNLGVIRGYFAAYNRYLAQYRKKMEEVNTLAELRQLGDYERPRRYPLKYLNATDTELSELMWAHDSNTFNMIKELHNKVSALRGEVPEGTMFFRIKVATSQDGVISKVGWEANLDIGTNGYLKAGDKVSASVEVSEGPMTSEVGLEESDGKITKKRSVGVKTPKIGKKGEIEYTVEVSEDELGVEKATVKLKTGKWGVELDSEGKAKMTASPVPGIVGVEGSVNPTTGEFVEGATIDVPKVGTLFIGVGFFGPTTEGMLETFHSPGFFEPGPSDFENMAWSDLSGHQFQQAFNVAPPVFNDAQKAYIALGFDAQKWEAFRSNPSDPPKWGYAMVKPWSTLTTSEKIAAISLGYYEGLWNKRVAVLRAKGSTPTAGQQPEERAMPIPGQEQDNSGSPPDESQPASDEGATEIPEETNLSRIAPREMYYWLRDHDRRAYAIVNREINRRLYSWMSRRGQTPRNLTKEADVLPRSEAYRQWQAIRDQVIEEALGAEAMAESIRTRGD